MKSVEGQVSGLAKDIISKVGLSVSWSGKRSCGLHHPCVGWPLGIAHAVRRPHLCARFASGGVVQACNYRTPILLRCSPAQLPRIF
eukprot:scaffold439_cov415-Prasinococcus_capsulatus_cf.AAC.49